MLLQKVGESLIMDRAINDATLGKAGDIYQYYIALRDCFKMKTGDKLQIEINGDVSLITNLSQESFQKEVKHHFGKKNLAERDKDFWKTLSNWYVEYDKISDFSNLILFTTASISSKSPFYKWNEKGANDKLNILLDIGKETKEREETFRKFYNKIFDRNLFDEGKIKDILRRFTIEASQYQITGISSEFNQYIGYIPECNRDLYIAALLGRIVSIVKEPPHKWEVTRDLFDLILQQESPNYVNKIQSPLPVEFENLELSEESIKLLHEKNFVEEIKRIQYEREIPYAISDYWRAQNTVIRYFRDNFLYVDSLKHYRNDLEVRLRYAKEEKVIETNGNGMDRNAQIRNSQLLYVNVMKWSAEDFGSIIRNQGYFQRGIIHTIVDEKKFNWDVGDRDEH